MVDWISIEQWAQCESMARSGIVFEIRNAHGQTMMTACVPEVPRAPFDWTGPPIGFRPVTQSPARHSEPLPDPS